jgi:Fe-S cluster assembly protein SufD
MNRTEEPVVASAKASLKRDTYLNALLDQAAAAAQQSVLSLAELRETAKALVGEHTFPSPRDEAWRFTDLSPMLPVTYQAAGPVEPKVLEDLRERVASLILPEAQGRCLVFVNGYYAAALSSTADLPSGVTLTPLTGLTSAPDPSLDLSARLARLPGSHEVFTALNTVGFVDAAVIRVAQNQLIEQPIQVLYLIAPGAAPLLVQPRCLVIAEANSSLTLIEQFWSGDQQTADFSNSVTELWLQENAQVNHVRLQEEGQTQVHIGKTAVSQGQDSRYQITAITLGAKIARHHLEIYQAGPQTETHLYGLSALQGSQLADTHSLIALQHPYGTASQLQKNIVDDRAHAVFNGKVFVPREAQQTNAAQLNRNLLLSNRAKIDTKPELDIVADNVKCAHGATVSQLAADEVFYLQSRGIAAAAAQRLLLYAFAMEVVDKISLASLKARLAQHLNQWTLLES